MDRAQNFQHKVVFYGLYKTKALDQLIGSHVLYSKVTVVFSEWQPVLMLFLDLNVTSSLVPSYMTGTPQNLLDLLLDSALHMADEGLNV